MYKKHRDLLDKYMRALNAVADLEEAGDTQLRGVVIYLFAKFDRMRIDGPQMEKNKTRM